jgi:ABC-type phosphate transport system substrate-binding protein
MFKQKGTSVISLVLLFALATASKPLVNALIISPSWAQSVAARDFPLPETVASGTTVRVDGSSSMAVLNQALQKGFEQKYPGTKVAIGQGGTSAALKSLQDGNADLAAIGRPLTEQEQAQGLKAVPVKREKIAVVVGTDNPFQGSLTDQQFAKIFRGEIKDWSEVGGAPGPIRLVDRPGDSDTRTAFQIYPVFKQADFASAADAVKVDADQTSDIAAKLGKDGISYAIANQVRNLSGVRIVLMHKTDADDPRYPFSQPLAYVYKGATPSPAAQAFLGFVSAPVGQQLIAAAKTAEAPAVASSSPAASPTVASSPESAPVVPTSPAVVEPSGGIPPWLWLLLLPAIGIPLWLWLKNRRSRPAEVSARQPEIPVTVGSPPLSQGTSGVVSSDLTTRVGPVSSPAGATAASPTNVPESAEELSELLEDITESGKKESSTNSAGPAIAGAAALAAGAAGAIFSRQSEPAESASEPDVAEAVTQESPAYVPLEDSTVIQDDTVVLDTPQETTSRISADTAEESAIQWRSEPFAVDPEPQDSALDWLEPATPLVPFEDTPAPDEDLALDEDLVLEDPSVIVEAPTEEVETDFNFLGGLSSLGGMAIAGGAAAAGAAAWSGLQEDDEPISLEEVEAQPEVNRETETLDISEDLSGLLGSPESPQTGEDLPSLFETSASSEELSALLEDFPEEATTLEDLPSLFDFPPGDAVESTEDQELSELAAMFDLGDQADDAFSQPDVLLPEFPLSTEPLTGAMEFQASSQPEEDDFSFLFDDADEAQALVEPEGTLEEGEIQSLQSEEESDLWGLLEDLPGAAAIAGGAALGAGAMAWSSLDAEPDTADDESNIDLSALLSELGDFDDEDLSELADEDLSAIESSLQPFPTAEGIDQPSELTEAIDHTPPEATDFAQGRVMAGEAALAAGAGVAAWSLVSGDRTQESVEATKFDIGTSELPQEVLASVDEGLAELPQGYGQSRIVLMPRDPQWAYAYWDVPNEHKQELRQQGGEHLALRLYDATDIDLNYQRPHSLQQYECDELARDWYVPIPLSDRDYVIEIGYLSGDGNWLMLARSFPVRIPPTYPSDWFEEQFITVSWDEDLRGKTLLKLVPPNVRATASANPIYDQLFAMTQSTEAQRVAGSLFGSMQQVPEMTVSSFVFPSGAGMWALPTLSGINMSGIGFSASAPPIRPRNFWLIADAELIVYGATEPDATLTIGGRPIQLSPDGTFRFRMSFQDGLIDYPIMAVAADGEQNRSIHMKFTRETPQRNTNTKDQAIDEWPS